MATQKKVKQLTETKVTHVSLVKNPANEESFLMLKSGRQNTINLVVKQEDIVFKSDDEKQLIYGIVYSPDRLDTDGEFMTADDIQKSAHGFLSEFRNIDGEHDFISNLGTPVESYIAQEDITIGEKTVTKGSWVLVVKATDEAWADVKAGKFNGFSLAGTTTRKEVTVEVDADGKTIKGSIIKGAIDNIVQALTGKKDNQEYNIEHEFNTLATVVKNATVDNLDNEELTVAVEAFINEMGDFMSKSKEEGSTKTEKKYMQNGKPLTDKPNEDGYFIRDGYLMHDLVYRPAKNGIEALEVKKQDDGVKTTEKQIERENTEEISPDTQKIINDFLDKIDSMEKRIKTLEETNTRLADTEKLAVELSKSLKATADRVSGVEETLIQSNQIVNTDKVEKTKRTFNMLKGKYDE